MVANDYAGLLVKRGALETIASRLAPTGFRFQPQRQVGTRELTPCRSELARERRQSAAHIQAALVIVNVFREQARSHRERTRLSRHDLPTIRVHHEH
ncbi:hypothetical protein EI969_25505 [Pseudomonas sp. PB101]|nr:hypothetical protein [Pseudomonas sp. PB101]